MKTEDQIERLQRIQRVKAPDHLLSRVHAKIAANTIDKISPMWALSMAAVIALLVMFNVMYVRNTSTPMSSDGTSDVATEMNLLQSNQLYYE